MSNIDPLKGVNLPQPYRGWFERLRNDTGNFASKVLGMTLNNVFIADANGDLKDSGSPLPSGTIVDEEYVGERFITENLLPEADPVLSPFLYDDLVDDDGSFLLPEINSHAFGRLTVCNAGIVEASAEFEYAASGTIELITSTPATVVINQASPGTDGMFNLGLGTTNPVICKNRLGGQRRPMLRLWYR